MVVHQITMNTSLPFVHTARRFYRLNNPMRILDVPDFRGQLRKVRANGGNLVGNRQKLFKSYYLEEEEVVTR